MGGIFKMIDFLSWDREFDQLIFLAFYPLRVPSEALEILRAFKGDPIGEPVNQCDKGLIGVGTFKGVDVLAIELEWRTNLSGGDAF